MIRNWCNPISHYTQLQIGMESEHWLTLPNTRHQVQKTELTAVSQLGGLQSQQILRILKAQTLDEVYIVFIIEMMNTGSQVKWKAWQAWQTSFLDRQ